MSGSPRGKASPERVVVSYTTSSEIVQPLSDGFPSPGSGQDVYRLLERCEVLGGDQYRSRVTVPGDQDSVMSSLDIGDVLREAVLGFTQRHGRHR